jgi:hypothetical protein
MIVDIGGGTTEVAVISLGGIVVSQSLRVGGDEMDDAIVNHIKKEYKLLIGQQTAEEIKLEVGSAYRMREEVQAEVRGRDMLTGLPKTVILSSEEVRRRAREPGRADHRRDPLDARTRRRPELAADIMDRGHRARRRRRAPARLDERPAATRRRCRCTSREPAHVRRGRLRPQPRGVRGDPPQRPRPPRRNGRRY